MAIDTQPATYGQLTRTLHWSLAVLIFCLIVTGYLADDVKAVIPLHKAVGMAVLVLSIARLLWWPLDTSRPNDEDLHWEKWPARLAKWSLAILGLAQPLSGWAMSSAAGKPIVFFGLFTVPSLLDPDKGLAGLFKDVHETLATLLWMVVALHVLGALRHHFIVKDAVLVRMLPWLRSNVIR
jgi:cytochrome b561